MKLKDEIGRTRETKSNNGFGYFYIQRKGECSDQLIQQSPIGCFC